MDKYRIPNIYGNISKDNTCYILLIQNYLKYVYIF